MTATTAGLPTDSETGAACQVVGASDLTEDEVADDVALFRERTTQLRTRYRRARIAAIAAVVIALPTWFVIFMALVATVTPGTDDAEVTGWGLGAVLAPGTSVEGAFGRILSLDLRSAPRTIAAARHGFP